jgi:purine nucleosidase
MKLAKPGWMVVSLTGDGLGNTRRPMPDGLFPSSEPARDLLLRLCAEAPGKTSIVALGPLTNLAIAAGHDPAWPGRVQELVAMAGSARSGGNALPLGEANVAHDPIAAMRVVEAHWARPPLMVGLDVTHRATLTDAEFALLAEQRTPAAAFLDAPLRFYRPYGSIFTAPDCPCHDLFAVLALAEPGIVTDAPVLPLAVDTGMGAAWGTTVVDFRAIAFARAAGSAQERPAGFHPWRIALDADVVGFRTALRRLFGEKQHATDR